jgi:hypothetical protein
MQLDAAASQMVSAIMNSPVFPHVVITISSKLRAVRIRELSERALKANGATSEQIARFKLDCLDHGTLVAAQRWITVRVKS